MRELFLGEYIRQERLKRGITQEQLCEGICEPITVSHMENGKQMPSYNRICAFLQRLGLPDDRYFALLSKNELEIKRLQDEIRADMVRFQRAEPEKQLSIRTAGLQKLKELEKLAEPEDQIIRQYILSEMSIFGKPDGAYTPEEQQQLLLDALHTTLPNLNLDELNLGLYTMEETTLVNQLAVTYVRMDQPKKAIDIYSQLLKYVQKHYCEGMSWYAGKFALVTHNYTRTLFMVRRYDDALDVAELGRKVCVEYAHYQFLPGLLDLIGGCYFYQGNVEKCKEYYRDAYCLYKVIGNDHDRILLEQTAKERLGLEFPFF